MCPECGSGNVSLSPKTGALCLCCNCHFDPAHARGTLELSALRQRPEPLDLARRPVDPAFAAWV